MHGYIVFCHQKNLIEIRDFLFSENQRATNLLMKEFFNISRLLGADAINIELVQGIKTTKLIKQFGFQERNDGEISVIFIPKEMLVNYPFLQERPNWFLMQSDSDI